MLAADAHALESSTSWVSADELALPLLHIAGRADPRRAVPAAAGQEAGLRRLRPGH
jgi:hypothetical protein